jgi:hypothetical protein
MLPLYVFMAWCLVKHGDNFNFPLDRRLDGPQNQSGYSGEEKKFQPLPGIDSRLSSQ